MQQADDVGGKWDLGGKTNASVQNTETIQATKTNAKQKSERESEGDLRLQSLCCNEMAGCPHEVRDR